MFMANHVYYGKMRIWAYLPEVGNSKRDRLLLVEYVEDRMYGYRTGGVRRMDGVGVLQQIGGLMGVQEIIGERVGKQLE